MPSEEHPKNRCFLALPPAREFDAVHNAMIEGAEKAGFQAIPLDQDSVFPGSAFQQANG